MFSALIYARPSFHQRDVAPLPSCPPEVSVRIESLPVAGTSLTRSIRRTLRASLLPTSNPDRPPLYMPANTSIILTTVLTHRDKAIWGEDAEVLNIDRWANMGKEREAFTSWNIGPRMVSVCARCFK